MRRLILAATVVLLLLGSCKKDPIELRPRPAIGAPDQWTARLSDDSAIDNRWWRSFEDQTLEELVKNGLEHNYNLQAAAARIQTAIAQAKIAEADLFPTVNAGLNGSKRRQNFIGLPLPGAEGKVLSRTFTSYGLSTDVSWEADVWGRLSAGKVAALADYEAAEADFRAARLSLVAQIAKAWFAAREGVEQVRLSERTVDSYRETVERIQRRYRTGVQGSLDLRLALSSLASTESLLEQRRQQLDILKRQLEILIGRYPAAVLDVSAGLPNVPPEPPIGLPSELAQRRPDLIAAESRLFASDARWEQSRRALYPRISFTASAGTATQSLKDLLNGDFLVWSFLGNIIQPVFDGGRLRAQVNLSDARSQEALAFYTNSILQAFGEVETALAAERFLAQQERTLAEAARQAAAAQQLARGRYDEGLEPFVTVLEAQRRTLTTESTHLAVRRLQLDARVDLHLALGGDFEENSPVEQDAEDES